MATYVVVRPLVIARDEEGRDVYLYRGGIVPGSISHTELARLRDGGFIETVAELVAEPEQPQRVTKK